MDCLDGLNPTTEAFVASINPGGAMETLPEAVWSICDAHPSLPIDAVCGAVAAISPGLGATTGAYAALLVDCAAEGVSLPYIPTYTRENVAKAKAILLGADPKLVLKGSVVMARYWWLLRQTRGEVAL